MSDKLKKIYLLLSAVASIVLLVLSIRHTIGLQVTEVLGFITGGYCVWLTVEENIWNWPIGIANNVIFLILFWHTNLFSDSALQIVYIVLGVLGWYLWLRGGPNRTVLKVRRITSIEMPILTLITIVSTIAMTCFLRHIHDSAPFLDAFTTVLSLVAQYLLCIKVFENWPVWMLADIIYVGLYWYKDLHLTAVLYALFFFLCVQGLRYWKRSMTFASTDPRVELAEGTYVA
jgi:nicotinamide mononucleotide transporter